MSYVKYVENCQINGVKPVNELTFHHETHPGSGMSYVKYVEKCRIYGVKPLNELSFHQQTQ